MGLGSAAGPTFAGDQSHGLLELIERDAVALRQLDGLRSVAVNPDAVRTEGANALLVRLRGGRTGRRYRRLDVPTEFGAARIAALRP